ncbi:MAG: ATP-binding protein [Pseudomonadota bacterium]
MLAAKERVLLVDDEAQILTALEDLLGEQYTVFTSETPERALELVRDDQQIAVVITDQRMPQMCGDEFLRKMAARSNAIRIMVSGFADLPAVLRAVNEGKIFAYVTKPWDEQDLLTKVHGAVELFRLAKELEYERRLLQDLMDNCPDGIYFKDADLRFLRANGAFAKSIGDVSPESLVGRRLSEVPGRERQGVASETEDRLVMREGRPVLDSIRRTDVAGLPQFTSETKALIRGALGDVMGIVGIARDVTERAVASENLRLSEARLQSQTGILNSVLEGMADGVVVTMREGKTLLFSDQAGRLLGAQKSDTRAEDWSLTYGLCVGDGETPLHSHENPLCRVLAGEPVARAEVCVKSATVSGTFIALTATPMKDPSGAVVGTITLLRDMTQQRAVQQQLAQSQRMEIIGRLAGGIAHDFNNLLTVVVGCAELTLEDLAQDDGRRGNVDEILAAARHGSLLTQQLLAFSRQQIIHPKNVHLNQVVTGVESILRRFTGEHIRLSLELLPQQCMLSADQSQVEQVLLNLVINARDAMPEGGELRIETGEETLGESAAREIHLPPGRYTVLTVADNGTGMTESTQARLFEPFFTTKEFGKGTGLGLSTVHEVVRQNAGHIAVRSTLGKGTEFRILLPQSRVPIPLPSSIPPDRSAGIVLLLETDAALRALTAKILRAEGHRVLQASNIGDGRRLLSQEPCPLDLFLTDLDTKSAAFAVELSRQWPSMRTVFMTGGVPQPEQAVDPALIKHALLAKPFSRSVLVNVVHQTLLHEDRGQEPSAASPEVGRDDAMTEQSSLQHLSMRVAAPKKDWLVGGGEMAELIRTMDWSKSTLGSIESWPQSLRTTVSLSQAASSPMSLSWGVGHVQIYNDRYRPLCGAKHPGSMGQDFRECWASAFSVIGEAYASAWSGKSAYLENVRLFLDRHGFLEETWFSFGFSPITDEAGEIAGVFHPVTEMTSPMLSERRTKTTRDLSSRASKARTSEEALSLCTEVLAEADLDLPFSLIYLLDAETGLATLASQTGFEPDSPQCPPEIDTTSGSDLAWGVANVAQSGSAQRLDNLRTRLADVTVGPYPEQPHSAMVLPVVLPGGDRPAAVIVAGVSARLQLLESYREFYELIAAGVATALAGARAYQEERVKAVAVAVTGLTRAKNAFFANVSHEFRTPLTLILGPVEDALAHGTMAGEDLETVYRNAARLLRLVDSLLQFSRLEAGRLQSSFRPTDLSMLTTALAASFDSLLKSTGLRLVVDCAPLPELVYVDRSHWEKIVLNLISNAFKYTLKGTVAVQLRLVSEHVELSVNDTGTGIPAHELPKIFERFHRIEGSQGRGFEGTGIGLVLVNELSRAHGGTVRVESIVGRGSTFVVSLPLGAAHLPEEQVVHEQDTVTAKPSVYLPMLEAGQWRRSTAPPARPHESDERKQRILVVDDNADMSEYLGCILRPYWEVELVDDGQAALRSALENPPDLILSDVMMPGMDGVALVRALRENTRTAGTPVLLLSARAGEEAVIEGLEALADDYLVKPFSSRELLTRVRTHLRMSNVRQRLQAQLVIADRMSAVGVLAAGVAHEINNPLSFVISNLDLILEGIHALAPSSSSNASELEVMANEARDGASRVAQIVSGMKTFARADEERPISLDVRPLLELSINVASNELKQRARIVKDFEAVPLVEADEARLGQVFLNLLVNAAQSISKGDIHHNQVKISTRTDPLGQCVVEMCDTGRGIAPETLDRIFDPFFTTKAIGEGTGLGLSICHSIVRAIGGELTAHSELGVGSTFRIVLPAIEALVSEPGPERATALTTTEHRGRVLIIDDDAMVGAMLCRILDKEHDVTVLSDGKQAIELLLAGDRFDVILCDLMMPKITGMDIYATLSSALPELLQRLVFVTGGAVTASGRKFLEDVPNLRVEKPFSANKIRTLVRDLLSDSQEHVSAKAE